MKNIFGIDENVKLIAPFQGFDSYSTRNIGLHPMLMIAPLRGYSKMFFNFIGFFPIIVNAPVRGFKKD